jgi:hypothetical protein
MPEIRTFGLMSGEGKRGIAIAPVLASTQPTRRREWQRKRVKSAGQAHRLLSAHDDALATPNGMATYFWVPTSAFEARQCQLAIKNTG